MINLYTLPYKVSRNCIWYPGMAMLYRYLELSQDAISIDDDDDDLYTLIMTLVSPNTFQPSKKISYWKIKLFCTICLQIVFS